MMHPSTKRARGGENYLEEKIIQMWTRMVQKLMMFLQPVTIFFAQYLLMDGGDPRAYVERMIKDMPMEDLREIQEVIRVEIQTAEQKRRASPGASSSRTRQPTTSYSPSPTPPSPSYSQGGSSDWERVSNRSVWTGPKDYDVFQPIEINRIGDVPGRELIFGQPPTCRCNLACQLHLCCKPGANHYRTFWRTRSSD